MGWNNRNNHRKLSGPYRILNKLLKSGQHLSTRQKSENDTLKEVIECVHAQSRYFGILLRLAEMLSFIKEQDKMQNCNRDLVLCVRVDDDL